MRHWSTGMSPQKQAEPVAHLAAALLSGVDFRGQRGYVVAPPSVHPDGHRYRWINALHEELAPAPHWFLQLLVPERRLAMPNAELQRSRAPSRPARWSGGHCGWWVAD